MVLIWKHGTRVLTAGVGAVAMHVKRDDRVSLVGTDLVIVNVTQSDAGSYTCELDTDDLNPLAVSHNLQILGRLRGIETSLSRITFTKSLPPSISEH